MAKAGKCWQKSKSEIYDALNVNDNTGKTWIAAWVKADLLDDVTTEPGRTVKRYYQLAGQAKEKAEQIRKDEKLGIEDIALSENQAPSENNNPILGADATLACAAIKNTKQNQAVPSDQANNQQLGTCPSLVSLGISHLVPSESASNSAVTDTNSTCPANSEKCINGEEIFRV